MPPKSSKKQAMPNANAAWGQGIERITNVGVENGLNKTWLVCNAESFWEVDTLSPRLLLTLFSERFVNIKLLLSEGWADYFIFLRTNDLKAQQQSGEVPHRDEETRWYKISTNSHASDKYYQIVR